MKRKIAMLFIIFLFLALGQSAQAIPSLQLDIADGTYNTTTETIVATTNPFTLYAYLIPDGNALLTDTYYISAAVTPKVDSSTNLGSFTVNGVPINVTSGMVYGTAPMNDYDQGQDPGDLAKHDIFETYFIQFAFTFDSSNKATAYNTQDDTGSEPTPNSNGTMYYEDFTIDTSLLDPGYFIHFDLYNSLTTPVTEQQTGTTCIAWKPNGTCKTYNTITVVLGNDIDINSFAPFSHDAQSNGHKVPEPSSLWLMGLGLLGLGFFARKRQ